MSKTPVTSDYVASDEASRSFRERTQEAMDSLRESMATARERCGEFYDGARDKVVAGARTTDEAIRTHPYASLAVALGVGVVLGALVARRRE